MVQPPSLLHRLFDLVAAGTALLLLAPVMLIIALLVKLSSRGPVLFKQTRAGLGGRPFSFYKFRTMYVRAEERVSGLSNQNERSGPIFKIRNDPRVTSIGRWLRRTSLDELPQLWNVFRGDLTLVGPRPPILDEIDQYQGWHRQRLNVQPGITGVWQVNGRSELHFDDWMRFDVRYQARRSWKTDIGILLRTIPAVLSGRGAY